MEKIACITLHQPWASLVMAGFKKYETRAWKTKHRGLLYIHAGKFFDAWHREICQEEPFKSLLEKMGFGIPVDTEKLPKGCLIGSVMLEEVYASEDLEPNLSEFDKGLGDFSPGRYAWLLKNPQPLVVPIPASGKQALFYLPKEILGSQLLLAPQGCNVYHFDQDC